jgi:beta-glucuronidase
MSTRGTETSIDLSGQWSRTIAGTAIDFVEVPGSYPPVGECVLQRSFQRPWTIAPGERVFLVTDGVLASAEFTVNGAKVGTAGAWATYRFELTSGAIEAHDNVVQARVVDLPAEFGPMPGRRFDGGLPRAIRIERRPSVFLSDVCFTARLTEDLKRADVTVTVEIDGAVSAPVEITLVERATGREVARARTTATTASVQFAVEAPRTWSPERPDLYTLTATLPGDVPYVEQVGFRRLEAKGRDLWLNGERLLLKGVCRHEFTHASGYAPSHAEIRRELERIRFAGFNYIRLVHSPHAGAVCRLAAEIGLLVSEEPGTCWHDLADERIAAPAVECLRRTILRDRNVPSIVAWFIYNECNPVTAYAVRIAKMCRELDPGCLVAMADCSGDDAKLKEMAAAAALSFYGINLYAGRKAFIERMRVLNDRPVLFTEWSGFLGQGNARQMADYCDLFVRHSRSCEPLRLIGGSIWVWADYEEHSRPSPASVAGWTVEGLVHADGRAKPDLAILSQMCFDMGREPVPVSPPVVNALPAARRPQRWEPLALEHVSGDQRAAEERFVAARRYRDIDNWQSVPQDHEGYAFTPALPRYGQVQVDGIGFRCRDAAAPAMPLLLSKERERLVIPVGRRVAGLAVLGHVSINGYPAPSPAIWKGEYAPALGAVAAEYELVFADGVVTVPLRHGIEILRHNDICKWWTPTPLAAATRPALRATLDSRYEVFRLDLWETSFAARQLVEIRWVLKDREALLVMAGAAVLDAC